MGLLETNAITRLGTKAGVDLNSATEQTLFTVPSVKEGGVAVLGCVVTELLYRNATASLTTVAWSAGWNAGTCNDVVANGSHTGLDASSKYERCEAKAGGAVGDPGDALKHKNNTLQGSGATIAVDVFGYLY